MSGDEWFRNTSWNETVALVFEEKLRRARRKSQYLRIQACTLAATHPSVALALLDRYFALGDDFDHAQAHVDRATAYLVLGEIDAAVQSYEAALEREEVFPNLRTAAYLELPYQIALHALESRYEQAMRMLAGVGDRLMFPVDHFKVHATKAMLLAAQGDERAARAEARSALEFAATDRSAFQHHRRVGLVSDKHVQALSKLRRLCDA